MNSELHIGQWIDLELASGRHAFSLEMLRSHFSSLSDEAIKRSLSRLSEKGAIVSVHKGYYVIVSPEYRHLGLPPVENWIDGLMSYLKRSYYLGLLSAASIHGATHQRAQVSYVITGLPAIREKVIKGHHIRFMGKHSVAENLCIQKNTTTGLVSYSGWVLTAADLIQFERRIGGLDRVAGMLREMAEELNDRPINWQGCSDISMSLLQRLGYILDEVLEQGQLAAGLLEIIQSDSRKMFPVRLKSHGSKGNADVNQKWKVLVNHIFEIE